MNTVDEITGNRDLDALYHEFLEAFYSAEDFVMARDLAARIELKLVERPDLAESIRGDELRSLLAELDGNIELAIEKRQSEIRRIFELHSQAQGTPGWDYVFRQYNYRDVGDRMDLLANLHAQAGDYEEAINVLNDSRNFCETHQIPFDGDDLMREYTEKRRVDSSPSIEPRRLE